MWTVVPYDPSNFLALPSGQWTVRPQDQITWEYRVIDTDTLLMNWVIGNTNVSGNPIFLAMRLPAGFVAVSRIEPLHYYEESTFGKKVGWFDVNPNDGAGGTLIRHLKLDDSPWLNTTAHDCSVHGSVVIRLS